MPEAEQLLDSEGLYAQATGDAYDLARSATTLAKAIWDRRPKLAFRGTTGQAFRPMECLRVDNGRPSVPRVEGDGKRNATRRGSHHTLSEQRGGPDRAGGGAQGAGSPRQAEALYRETVDLFPNNVVARTGLAEVLKAQGGSTRPKRFTGRRWSPSRATLFRTTGLADVLKAQSRLDEAENVYREALRLTPGDAYARAGLKSVLVALGTWNDEAARSSRSNR